MRCIFILLLLFFQTVSFAQQPADEQLQKMFDDSSGTAVFGDLQGPKQNMPQAKSLPFNEKRLKAATRSGNNKGIAAASNYLGWIYFRKGDHDQALKYFEQSLEARESMDDGRGEGLVLAEIGYVHATKKNYSAALDYYKPALKKMQDVSFKRGEGIVAGFIAQIYAEQKQNNIALDYFKQSLNVYNSLSDKKSVAGISNSMGQLYTKTNEYDKAIESFKNARKLRAELNDSSGEAIALRNIGLVHYKKGDYENAVDHFKKSLALSDQLSTRTLLRDTYLKLSAISSVNKNFSKANEYDRLYKSMNDTVGKIEKSRSLTNEQMRDELLEKSSIIEMMSKEKDVQYKQLSQQELLIKQQQAEAELDALKKQKAIEILNDSLRISTLGQHERDDEIERLIKEQALTGLALSNKELELKKQENVRNILIAASLLSVFILFFIYNRYRNKKKSHTQMDKAYSELTRTHLKLKLAQDQLIQSEKMASLGELTAGIAHEIQNPLNFVNNFSELSMELIDELRETKQEEEKEFILDDIKSNLSKILEHGKRADGIVKGMLLHSRTGSAEKQLTDINNLVEEFFNLAFHGMRAKDSSFNSSMQKNLAAELPQAMVFPQDISRVVLNLFNNSFYAVNKRKQLEDEKGNTSYQPTVSVATELQNNFIVIRVCDNGTGIPQEVIDKIYAPFFTTKPTGEGTGLGLSLSYDIVVKGHSGRLNVDSKINDYTEFSIWLPVK